MLPTNEKKTKENLNYNSFVVRYNIFGTVFFSREDDIYARAASERLFIFF
tara:strand:+ start:1070 stop:1219 length:150 start_codon:yes stop_codon:yes gene_type:complete